ncbi:hypothetical protein AMJ44_07520 [candidate division WOR-1 bacterium DG_54_3]|jgi:hypothetical protein|uniref:Outer membrane protein beta-barrel domain-containing protein n=1 Tax=candidate division WOR-1 bacterium DG_54_3 TaxID=1703775 RepID=A0A0S7XX53_UNCSA|nr:MAG: hypothetical protein AMJ44_07520 [candidate division WOR-1 bacterium DG_54_3]
MKKVFMIVLIFVCALGWPALGGEWTLEGFLGTAWNLPTPLTIVQNGYPDIALTARYKEHTFEGFPYYALRVSRWSKNRAWELDFVHHKIYLDNPPSDVQNFSISDGYNLLMVNRAWETKKFIWRVGAGVIITHPESTVRDKVFDESKGMFGQGYYVSGPTIQGAVGKRLDLWKGLYVTIEGKLTASFARVSIVEGHADASNVAFHILVGLGYRMR